MKWKIVDSYKIEIDEPKYVGYQLGRLRLEDNGRTLYRATTVKDDKFIFESIGIFNKNELKSNKSLKFSTQSI